MSNDIEDCDPMERSVEALLARIEELEATLALIQQLRNNIIGTQSASWSNAMYPLVAILNAAGFEWEPPTDDQLADHMECYGGAGGHPGKFVGKRSPQARRAEVVERVKRGYLWRDGGPARSTEVPNEQEPKPGRLVCWECGEPGVPRGPLPQRCVYCDAVYDGADPTFREGWTEGTP